MTNTDALKQITEIERVMTNSLKAIIDEKLKLLEQISGYILGELAKENYPLLSKDVVVADGVFTLLHRPHFSLWSDMVNYVRDWYNRLSSLISTLRKKIMDFINYVIYELNRFYYIFAGMITTAINNLKTWVTSIIRVVYDYIVSVINQVYAYIRDVYNQLMTWVQGIINKVYDYIENIYNTLSRYIQDILTWVQDKFNEYYNYFKDLINEVVDWAVDKFNDAYIYY